MSDPRERILAAADRLFYAEGFRAVGIDRIIAEAGVAKMSLYKHFASKDDLILAVLEARELKFLAMFTKSMERHRKQGMDRLEAFFAALKDWFKSPGFRGCAFINAQLELADAGHRAAKFSAAHKKRFYVMVEGVVAAEVGEKGAGSLAPAIFLMVEGAIVTAVMEQSSEPADVARKAALTLVGQKMDARV